MECGVHEGVVNDGDGGTGGVMVMVVVEWGKMGWHQRSKRLCIMD